jgi:thiaminase (transcriptional activator TenA)
VAAARAPADIAMVAEHAAGAIAVERSLHESFFAEFGMNEDDVAATPMAPTNLAYTSYLLASAYGGSFPEALGAVLPCYWIYWEVGKAPLRRGSERALPALDRDQRRGRVRGRRPRGARAHRPPRPAARPR